MSEPTGNTSIQQRSPLLIPYPRSVDVDLQFRVNPDGMTLCEKQSDACQASGYSLRLNAESVSVTFADQAGLRAAHATLAQLRDQYGSSVPHVQIEDAPALPSRGVMLDVSRTRVPQNEELHQVVETLAGLKLNHLQLYTEHAFAYAGNEDVWSGSDPITGAEIRSLDAYASARGVGLVPNQNCFGHLTRWLKDERYSHLAETQGKWEFLGMPREGPFSLCPIDDRSIHFVERLLDELLPCFQASMFNIGCDETYDVGQGRSADAVVERGKAEVYGRFVAQICNSVESRGCRPMMWGDIACAHPEVVGMLPPETIGLVWGYEPSSDFAAMGRAWRDSGRAWWVCPGTSSWRSFTGRSAERQANIRRAVREGLECDAEGLLVTDWGDVGHPQVWPITLMGVAEAADAAWTGQGRREDFLDAVSLHVFNDRSLQAARWLEALGDADHPLREICGVRTSAQVAAPLANASAVFTELHTPPMPLHLPAAVELWAQTRQRLLDLLREVPSGVGELVQSEMRHAAQCALFACDLAIRRREGVSPVAPNQEDLPDRLCELVTEHRRLWLIRSRPGGLDESVAFWNSIEINRLSKG